MIEKCANTIADWLINCEVVKETDKELYSYAVYSILLSLSPLLLAIGFGIGMGCVGRTRMVVSDMVMPAISIVHGIVISHQMWMGTCIDYCRSSCKPDLF